MFMIAEPRWMRSVFAATNGITHSGADMWEYSVSAWCSPYQAYFQLYWSAWIAVLHLTLEHLVLGRRVVRRRTGQIPVEEETELHVDHLERENGTRSNVAH